MYYVSKKPTNIRQFHSENMGLFYIDNIFVQGEVGLEIYYLIRRYFFLVLKDVKSTNRGKRTDKKDHNADSDYHQVASKGIRVNSVNPGVIVTGIFEKAGLTAEQTAEYYKATDF